MVAIFLLRAGRQPQIRRAASGSNEAGDPRAVQGRRSLRQRAGTGGAPTGGWRVYPALRLRAADAEREPLWQLAGLRRRRQHAVLRVALARAGHDQEDPAADHRGGHRLASVERTEARAEGIRKDRGAPMPQMQTRRRVLSAIAAIGAVNL